MKYTSFQVFAADEVRDLCSVEEGILALSPSAVALHTRQGMPVFNYKFVKKFLIFLFLELN